MGSWQKWRFGAVAGLGIGMFLMCFASTPTASAQNWRDPKFWAPEGDRLSRIEPGTFIQVRTNQGIDSNRADGRIYSGTVEQDVWDDYSRLAVPAIPRGSRVDLIVRTARDGDLVLDLASVYAHGERYEISAAPERVEGGRRVSGDDVAPLAGGGAVVGTIIGALTGGGKGAAIGAAAGATAGLALAYQGKTVRVPPGSVLTFRLQRGLDISVPNGPDRHRDRR